MSQLYDTVLVNGMVALPEATRQTNIALSQGKIAALDVDKKSGRHLIDCQGQHILPGIIDSQVHFRDPPGNSAVETLASGMKAALLGGITTVFEMPNTYPATTTQDALAAKLHTAGKQPWTNFAFYLGACAENASQLGKLERLPGVCGIKLFMGSSTGNLLCADDATIDKIFSNGTRLIAVHAEDEMIMSANKKQLPENPHVSEHAHWRSVESSISAVKRLVTIARRHDRQVHILHVTSAQELAYLAQNKDIASVEALPNHLSFHAPDCYQRLGTLIQQNPPVRAREHQEALWQAIETGIVDIVASDHAPHTLEAKAKPYPQSPSGTPGTQTILPLMLNYVNQGRLTLERLVHLMSTQPAQRFGIQNKGQIKIGYDADLTIVDLNQAQTISNASQATLVGWTPYDGMRIQGWPTAVFVQGQLAMQHGQLMSAPAGKMVTFHETVAA